MRSQSASEGASELVDGAGQETGGTSSLVLGHCLAIKIGKSALGGAAYPEADRVLSMDDTVPDVSPETHLRSLESLGPE